MKDPAWSNIPESGRTMLIHVARLLANGFTGRLELQCSQGGVKYMNVTNTYQPKDLPAAESGS